MSGETIDAIIRLMAQKDASVDRAASETEKAISNVASKTQAITTAMAQVSATPIINIHIAASETEKVLSKVIDRTKSMSSTMSQMSHAPWDHMFQSVSKYSRGLDEAIDKTRTISSMSRVSSTPWDHIGSAAYTYTQKVNEASKSSLSFHEMLSGQASFMGGVRNAAIEASIGFGAVSATLGILGNALLEKAQAMEVFRAKLETVLHSSAAAREALTYAVQFAKETPFEVQGVVDATVQLEVYGAKSREVLPLVANLAAGMGKSIEETALAVGKAWSGSLEGAEMLRNTYGITTMKLKQFGAEVNSAGELNLKTTASLERFRQALTAIASTQFSGAIERQMQTLTGAISNAKDEISRVEADLGGKFIPVVKIVAGIIENSASSFKALPDSMKDMFIAGGLVVGVTAAMVAAGMGLIVMYASYKKSLLELIALKAESIKLTQQQAVANTEEAATVGIATNANKAASATGALANESKGLASSMPAISAAVLGLTAVYIGATYATERYIQKQKEKQLAIQEDSQELQGASLGLRTWVNYLNEANKSSEGMAQKTATISDSLKDLQSAIAATDVDKLRQILASAGMKPDDIIKEGKADVEQTQKYRKQVMMLNALKSVTVSNPAYSPSLSPAAQAVTPTRIFDFDKLKKNYTDEGVKQIKEYAEQQNLTPQDVEPRIRAAELKAKYYERKSIISEPISKREQELKDTLGQVQQIAEKNKDYLDLSDKVKGIDGYTEHLKMLKGETMQIGHALMASGVLKAGDTLGTALEKYRNSNDTIEKEMLKTFILSMNDKVETQKKVDEQRRKSDGRILEDQVLSKKRAIDDEMSLDHIKFDEKLKREKELTEKLRAITKKSTDQQYAYEIDGQHKTVKASDWGKESKLIGPITKEQAELEKLRHDYWTDPEVKKKVDQELLALDKSNKSDLKESQRKHLEELNLSAEQYLSNSKLLHENDTQAQIDSFNTVTAMYEDAMKKRMISEEEGQKAIQKYRIDTAQLTKKMSDDQIMNQQRALKAEDARSDSVLKRYEKELAAGKDVQKQITDEVDKRLKRELEAIDLETQAKIKASDKTKEVLKAIDMESQNSKLQAVEKAKSYLDNIAQQTKTENTGTKHALETNTNPIQFTIVNGFGLDKNGKPSPGWEAQPSFSGYGYSTWEEMQTEEPVSAMARPDKHSAFGSEGMSHPDKYSAFGGNSPVQQKAKEYESVISQATKDLGNSISSVSDALNGLARTVTGVVNKISGGSSGAVTSATNAIAGSAAAASGAAAGAAAGAAKPSAATQSPAQIAGFGSGIQGLNMEQAARSMTNQAFNQAISNTFMFGGAGFTPPADVSATMGNLMARVNSLQETGFLGSGLNVGKLSY